MSRAATRRAIEWPRMIGGLTCITLGVLYFRVADGDLGFYLILFGLVVGGIALLGRGCGVCGKTCAANELCISGVCSANCRTVGGIRWCYNPNKCGEACAALCASLTALYHRRCHLVCGPRHHRRVPGAQHRLWSGRCHQHQ